jgi:hypothetical protein
VEIWIKPACSRVRTARPTSMPARAIQRPFITAADGTTMIGRDPETIATATGHEAG